MTDGATRGLLTIGDLAARSGLSLRSIRHYEDVGVLPQSERSPGGFRLYTEATVDRLLVVMGMKPLGFTLEQMRELLDALDQDPTGPDAPARNLLLTEYHEQVRSGINKLRARLASAEALESSLTSRLGTRQGRGDVESATGP